MPCENSCTTIAIISPSKPYHNGIMGFMIGSPISILGDGAIDSGICVAIDALQHSITTMNIITATHKTTAKFPNPFQIFFLAIFSIVFLPVVV